MNYDESEEIPVEEIPEIPVTTVNITPTVEDTKTEYWTIKSSPKVYQAIKNYDYEEINLHFDDKTLVNIPLQKSGRLGGYTALHIACYEGKLEMVKLLINEYHANVKTVAHDGAQPIHLACFFENTEVAECLLKAGANVDTELGPKLFFKYTQGKRWCYEFGYKMTILTYLVLYGNNYSLVEILIQYNANIKVKSLNNKTLLMYAVETNNYLIGMKLLEAPQVTELINVRDDEGRLVTHYIFLTDKYIYHKNSCIAEDYRDCVVVTRLISMGVDIYGTINGYHYSLLLNKAIMRNSSLLVTRLLPHYDDITKSKPLFYTIGLVKQSYEFLEELSRHELTQLNFIRERTFDILEVVLRDMVNRRTFGLPVAEEEIQLMDTLVTEDSSVEEFVQDYEQNFIEQTLKERVIQYGDDTITYYDFIMLCFDSKKIRLVVKNKTLIDAFQKSLTDDDNNDGYLLYTQIILRIERTIKRLQLLDELKKVQQLRIAIPLPYEIILNIVEYLNNGHLDLFIKSFIL